LDYEEALELKWWRYSMACTIVKMGVKHILKFGISTFFSLTKMVTPFDFVGFLTNFKHPNILRNSNIEIDTRLIFKILMLQKQKIEKTIIKLGH
jgi:hypothetical protein